VDSDTSIKRPVLATMFILALVVLGIVSYPAIGVDLFPKVEFPLVNITTGLAGASPEIMDVDVNRQDRGSGQYDQRGENNQLAEH